MCRWLRWTCGTFYGLLVLDFLLNHDIQRLENSLIVCSVVMLFQAQKLLHMKIRLPRPLRVNLGWVSDSRGKKS
jgi:hypothetical protein